MDFCTLAAAKIGAIVAAISTFSTPRELAWSLEHCGAVAMITLSVMPTQWREIQTARRS